jgi:hypothetical protein
MHPELVNEKVNPRSITTFFNCISSISNFDDRLDLIQMIGESSVGPEMSTLFTMFINNKLDKLITPKKMLLGKEDHQVIVDEIKKCIGEGNSYRADIASVLATRLFNFSLAHAEKETISKDNLDRISQIVMSKAFTNDLEYLIIKKLLSGNKKKFEKLIMNPEIMKIATK